MKLTRRGLFKAAAAVPIALTVGVPAHEHVFERDINFLGSSCSCGATVTDRQVRATLSTFEELRDFPGVWRSTYEYRENWGVEMRFG